MRSLRPGRGEVVLAVVALSALFASGPATAIAGDQLADLSLEELGRVEVTSVSKTSEPLLDAAASVYVITHDDIVRSGVTNIPEALRLAPGVEVARRSANAWSVTIRGFNGDLSNKLLVLIDGRSVYSPLYAGVFWDVQDMLLEDVDRIEVVSGPGGTLWGANAVNGVINIITRSSDASRGRYFEAGGGTEERDFAAFRYGGVAGRSGAFRVYAKYTDRDSSRLASGMQAIDDWNIASGGFRVDSADSGPDTLRLMGNVYTGRKSTQVLGTYELGTLPDGTIVDDTTISGGNLMGVWQHPLSGQSDFKLQAYFDRTMRDIPNTYDETRDTFDVDFQHRWSPGGRHHVLWGAGIRYTKDHLVNSTFATFLPASRGDSTYSLFIQDKIALAANSVYLTVGSKFEDNDYTGFEVQPSLRMSWLIDDRKTAWWAVSRAVRIPSRLDSDLQLTVPVSIPTIPFPIYVSVDGSRDFDSEELIAYEAGYRARIGDHVYLNAAAFVDDYDRLQTQEPEDPIFALPSYVILPNTLANNMAGRSAGGTLAVDWQPTDNWRLKLHYSYIHMDLKLRPESQDQNATGIAGRSPRHQIALYSFVDLFERLNLYLGIRHVDELPSAAVDAYNAVDLSLRWRLDGGWVAALTGENLTDPDHPEFGPGSNYIERTVYLKLSRTL
jgi:iron complex outermembrane recepter protein